jgi:hypothetical protein
MVKITLNDFPGGNIYIKLKRDAIKTIINLIKKSNLQLSKMNQNQIYRMEQGQKVSLNLIKNLVKTFNLPIPYIQDNLLLITSSKNTNVGIKNPQFAINFNTKIGIQFIATIMAKGSINRYMQIRINLNTKNKVNTLIKDCKKMFGEIDYKIYRLQKQNYTISFPRILGLLIIKLKLLPLSKSISNNNIPRFIFKTTRKKKKIFIQQYLSLNKNKKLQINKTINYDKKKSTIKKNLEKYSPNILIDLKKILTDLDINSRIRLQSLKSNKANWSLIIKEYSLHP